jgi:hypothetical protein
MILNYHLICVGIFLSHDFKMIDRIMTEVDFNVALMELNAAVLKKYSQARFYEMQGYLTKDVDGKIDVSKAKAVYGLPEKDTMSTVIASYDAEGKIKVTKYNDIWCEDMVTLPYVPLQASEAIDILKEKFGEVKACPITLRHALYPGEIEPKYFIGTVQGYHTVGVYSAQIDTSFVTESSNFMVMQRGY